MSNNKNYKPRTAGKLPVDHTFFDIDKAYKEQGSYVEETDYKMRRLINNEMNIGIRDAVLLENKEIHFPHRMGRLGIKKKKTVSKNRNKPSYIPKDWVASKKEGKWILNFNEHRDGYKYRIVWYKAKLIGVRAYCFKPTRTFKRKLADILFNKPQIDYYE